MHFYCTCGYRISDTSDFLSFKASVLSNQDEEDYVDGIEVLVKEESLCPGEQWERIFMEKMLRCLRRNLYQCPHCGRLHVEDLSGELHTFAPEGTVNKRLLTSVEGEAWRGFLWAEWEDEKPDCHQWRG